MTTVPPATYPEVEIAPLTSPRGKVTGTARFAADHDITAALHAAVLCSPYPHARIVSVDAERARAVPGVHVVLTGGDVRGVRFGRRLQDRPVLAWDRVRFIGDRVAGVAAESVQAALAAISEIKVEYEPLPSVHDPRAALGPEPIVLHPDADEHVYIGGGRPSPGHPNLQGATIESRGELDESRWHREGRRVFRHEFATPPQHHGYIEPHAACVWLDKSGSVHVVTTNKDPAVFRTQFSTATGVPEDRVVIHATHVGGDFGGKGYSVDEYLCYFLARASGRPVRAVMEYRREFIEASLRHSGHAMLETSVDADGRLVSHTGHLLLDGGAYAGAKPRPSLTVGRGLSAIAPYDLERSSFTIEVAYTNNVPGGHMRTPGMVQAVFAVESHVDMIASELGRDPLEFRLDNAVSQATVDPKYGDIRVREVLGELRSRWRRPRERVSGTLRRGRGLAVNVHHVGGHGRRCTVALEVRPDGRVQLATGIPDQGAGSDGVVSSVVSEALGVRAERIEVARSADLVIKGESGVGGSRVTHLLGMAASQAGAQLRQKLVEAVSRERDLATSAVDLRGDVFEVTGPDGGRTVLPFVDAIRKVADSDLAVRHTYRSEDAGPEIAATAAVMVEVTVDEATGALEVEHACLAVDVGAVLNPLAHEGQLRGGFLYGLGAALTEQVLIEQGVVATTSLREYGLPTSLDVVPLEIVLVPGGKGPGVRGAKAVGELVNPLVAPAVANAVADAVGVRVRSLPITPDAIWDHLRVRDSRDRAIDEGGIIP